MIKFTLSCASDHRFEAWFRDNADFDTQSKRGLVSCPICGTSKVGKTLMAPSVSTGRKREEMSVAAGAEVQAKMFAAMREMAKHVKANAENVGEKFAEEARKIHDGESDPRGIYGKATPEEVTELAEDGIEFMPLPDVPDEEELN
ncbi:MAG: DUF1178 family protein [Pseudomonadota bacterium]